MARQANTDLWRACIVQARTEITRASTGGLSKPKRKSLIRKRAQVLYRGIRADVRKAP